jgi:hypothetical protein
MNTPNNAFERTVGHGGPPLAAAQSSWPAAQRHIHGVTALMTFDGKRYPGNPSMQPHAPHVGEVLQLQLAAPNTSLERSRGR